MKSTNKKKVLVIGASLKSYRYSNMAILRLRNYGHEVLAIGIREGKVDDVNIDTGRPDFSDIDTVTLYINPQRQAEYFDYITGLKPKRIIFNPGTENSEFQQLAESKGIETLEACTLVMLSVGNF